MDVSLWLNQTINWSQKTGVTAAGDPVLAAPVAIPARVELQPEIVREGSRGTELEQGSIVYTLQKISPEDRIWYPGDSPASIDLTRAPLVSHAVVDRNGNILYYKTIL